MCAGGEVGRLLLRGPVATGILDPYAPAVALSADKPSPRKIPSSENLRARTLNGVARAAMPRVHTFRGFVATRESEKLPREESQPQAFLLPFVVHRMIFHLDFRSAATGDYICRLMIILTNETEKQEIEMYV